VLSVDSEFEEAEGGSVEEEEKAKKEMEQIVLSGEPLRWWDNFIFPKF